MVVVVMRVAKERVMERQATSGEAERRNSKEWNTPVFIFNGPN